MSCVACRIVRAFAWLIVLAIGIVALVLAAAAALIALPFILIFKR